MIGSRPTSLVMHRDKGMGEEFNSRGPLEMKRLRVNVTLITDFGVVVGSGNATAMESEVCVHEYGGGFGTVPASKFSPARGACTISSEVGV